MYAAQITPLFQETDETEDVPDVTLRQTEWSGTGLELEDVETEVVYNYNCSTIFDNDNKTMKHNYLKAYIRLYRFMQIYIDLLYFCFSSQGRRQ